MRKIREVLRLRFEAVLSARQVAASVQVARSSVGGYERRLAADYAQELMADNTDIPENLRNYIDYDLIAHDKHSYRPFFRVPQLLTHH